MEKIKKLNKIPISALLLLVDIPLLILLTKNLHEDIIFFYMNIRLLMIFFFPLIIIFKIIKTVIILFKESCLLNSVLSIARLEKGISDITDTFKIFLNIFMFYVECMVLVYLFMYSMDKTNSVLSIARLEKGISDITDTFKIFLNIFMFYVECMVLVYLFMYSMDKTKYLLESPNNLATFIAIISLNVILVLIHIYINKRCDNVVNIFKERKNLTV